MDRSGYTQLHDPPSPPSRVHSGYPRDKHQKVECAPAQVDECLQSTQTRPSFVTQRFELPASSKLLGIGRKPDEPVQYTNPFSDQRADSPLNPRSINFNIEEWVSNLAGFMAQDPSRYHRRSSGFSFENLTVHGFGRPTDYQKDVGNAILEIGAFFRWMYGSGKQKIRILHSFDGIVERGEMLLVLGRPGSGVTSLLKIISGQIHGLSVNPDSSINYQGVSATEMHSRFRGEAIYMAQTDTHFPNLTVGETLLFAAKAQAPRDHTFPGTTRQTYATHMRDVILAVLDLGHVENVAVGNDYVKGISGGERQRVSIGEAALSGCQLQCWDNSTRGLDSAHAKDFCNMVRLSTAVGKATACVALYQAPQSVYEMFDKVTVLYEGRQIYFGPVHEAKPFFTDLGFICGDRQNTADFLTSLTNPDERTIQPGYEFRVPRTPEEFVMVWKTSRQYATLMQELEEYENEYPCDSTHAFDFAAARRSQQAKHIRTKSPYTLSMTQQVALCIRRGFRRLRGDASFTISALVANSLMAMIVSIIFYNLPNDTSSVYSKTTLLFFSILLNAFASSLEILQLFSQRRIVEKHARYAFVHPFAEAISSMICDIPYKILNSILFNTTLYFMTNLRRTPSAFLTFLAISFLTTMTLSMVFRTIGAASRSLSQALCPAAIVILAFMIYAGFVIPPRDMVPWFRWISYVDPIAYAFESLMINEFVGQIFLCANFVPTGPEYISVSPGNRVCTVPGAVPGTNFVSGSENIRLRFGYAQTHISRNIVALVLLMVLFMITYLTAVELISGERSKGEILLFQRKHKPQPRRQRHLEIYSGGDLHRQGSRNGDPITKIQRQTSIFQWKDICLDIKTDNGSRRILDRIDGWVKPGTLTALMGPSGAGKTSLLDVLATRSNVGIISGEAYVDGCIRDVSFQRKTGYVQQQDFHLPTATVREALRFSAVMRQSAGIGWKEKFAYVEEIIKLLDMDVYADAIVGVPGEGLNIEQRSKLTIGIELVAKPKLLLFLDEPTSGLDSGTSWAILELLQRLTAHGQAILCTVHQPSATFFERFDRLLFLGPGGRPIYFGEIGQNCETVIKYFEDNGADACPKDGNVSEWIVQSIGCTPGSKTTINWSEVWRNSEELVQVHRRLESMKKSLRARSSFFLTGRRKPTPHREFAASYAVQMWQCFRRVNVQYWRTPSYIYSKIALSFFYALFLGLSFYGETKSIQDLHHQTFSVFMLLTLASNFVPQALPNFIVQRNLFEARELPAKVYSWHVFILSNILVEVPWNTLMAIIIHLCWYYPMGMYHNADSIKALLERNGMMVLFLWVYLIYASTFGHMMQAGIELSEMAGNLSNVAFLLSLMFCGILSAPTAQPQLWSLMYRASPFTYLVDGILSVGLAGSPIKCADNELLRFEPVAGSSCGSYMATYMHTAGGYLINPSAKAKCAFCALKDTNTFLASVGMSYDHRWRNFIILWIYVVFNVLMTLLIYWIVRVPKTRSQVSNEPVVEALQDLPLYKGDLSELGQHGSGTGSSHSEGSFVKLSGYKASSPRVKNNHVVRNEDIELEEF